MNLLRSALRGLLRRPFHTSAAVLTLALGLTAGIGVFTYANGFRQPFPGADAHGLVRVFDATADDPYGDVSYLDYLDYAQGTGDAFGGLAAVVDGYAASIRHEESTEVVFLEAVSGNAFQVLDIDMSAGRRLAPDDDRPGAEAVAVISWAWWQRQWNGDPSVIGSVVYFNFRPYTVVGVAAPEFRGSLASSHPDAWLPFAPFGDRYTSWARASEDRDVPLVRVYGRLRDGVSAAGAGQRLSAVAAGLDEGAPRASDEARRMTLAPATWIDPRARAEEAGTVRMMLVAALGLLLLVCANVGNLLLAVAAGRRREMALKSALGASRGTLVGQVLVESLLLSGAAGLLALGLAGPVSARLGSFFARPSVWGENAARHITVDARVVVTALVVSALAAVLAGMIPAFRAGRRDLVEALKTGSADGESTPRVFWGRRLPGARQVLVAAQVGLAVVLMVVAGLTLRSLTAAGSLETGFDHDHMVASYISTSSTGVTVEERPLWFRTLTERLAEEPWVRSATVSQQAPLTHHPSGEFVADGGDDTFDAMYATVIPGYFETLGIERREGRAFTLGDTLGAPDVAVVNQAFVRRWLGGGQAVGRVIRRTDAGMERSFEVVGVVSDAKIMDYLSDPQPVLYLPNGQGNYASGAALTVATTIDPAVAAPRLRKWLRDYENHVAIVNVVPYPEVLRGFTYGQRMNAQMFSALGVLGLLLSVVGVFAVMSLAVSRRRREFGIRMAVGARPVEIGRLVVGRAFAPVVLGLVAGGAAALLLSRLVRSLLFGVEPTDPVSFLGATAIFVVTALAAVVLPARRALSTDPARSLRAD